MCSGAYAYAQSDCIKILQIEEGLWCKIPTIPLVLKMQVREAEQVKKERRETVASVVWLSELRKQRKSEMEREEKSERTMTNGFSSAFLPEPCAACSASPPTLIRTLLI